MSGTPGIPAASFDWEGRPLPELESPDDVIRVWKITPHRDRDADHTLERDYRKAVGIAEDTIAGLMDDPSRDESGPIVVTVEIVEMTLADYLEIVSGVITDE